MRQILALLEPDSGYCARFSKYASARPECPFTVYTFQDTASLQRFAHQHPIDLLLSDSDALQDEALQSLPVGTRVELSEEPTDAAVPMAQPSTEPQRIYKYQSGEKILHELVSSYRFQKRNDPAKPRSGLARLYLIYSPIGRSGKTTFAESLAKELQKEVRTLYVSLEEMPAWTDASMKSPAASLSDVLFLYKQEHLVTEQLQGMISHIDGLDLIPPVRSPEDLSALPEAELPQFIEKLRAQIPYDVLVLDTDSMVSRIEGILPQADWIFMPVTDEPAHHRKLAALEHYLSGSPQRAALDRIVKLVIPKIHGDASGTDPAARLSEFTSAVIRNYIYDTAPPRALHGTL